MISEEKLNIVNAGTADINVVEMSADEVCEIIADGDDGVEADADMSADVLLKFMKRVLYGIDMGTIVTLKRRGGRPGECLEGHETVRALKALMKNGGVYYDSKNGTFKKKFDSSFCLDVKMLSKKIEPEKLKAAVDKLCGDEESAEFKRIVVQNLRNCNEMLSGLKLRVCVIECDEKIERKFREIF